MNEKAKAVNPLKVNGPLLENLDSKAPPIESPLNILENGENVNGFKVAMFDAPVNNTTNYTVANWKEFREKLSVPLFVPDNESKTKASYGQYFVRGTVEGYRNDNCLQDCHALILDIDKELDGHPLPTVKELSEGLSGIIHVAYSTATPGRSRVVVPVPTYKKELTNFLTRQLYNYCKDVGLIFAYAGESNTQSQPWFYGQTIKGNKHECIVCNNAPIFEPDHDLVSQVNAPKGDILSLAGPVCGDHNPTRDFIRDLQSGTIHDAVKRYAGWKAKTSDLTMKQIFDEITALIDSNCTDANKIKRWHKDERKKLEEWFDKNVEPTRGFEDDDQPEMATEITDDEYLDLDEFTRGCGFIERYVDILCDHGLRRRRGAAMLSVFPVLGGICHHVMLEFHCRPTVYALDIGPSGSGKSAGTQEPQTKIMRGSSILRQKFHNLSYASGPAFKRSLKDNPVQILFKDEIGEYLKDLNDIKGHKGGVAAVLMDLFTDHTGVYHKAGKPSEWVDTDYSFLSVFGSTTPAGFNKSLKSENISTGFLPRFIINFSDPKLSRMNDIRKRKKIDISGIRKELEKLDTDMGQRVVEENRIAGESDIHIGLTDDAKEIHWRYVLACQKAVDDDESGMLGAFAARRPEYALKLGFFHALSRKMELAEMIDSGDMLPEVISVDDYKWGQAIMKRYGWWLSKNIGDRIHDGIEGEVAQKILHHMKTRYQKGDKTVTTKQAMHVRSPTSLIKKNALQSLLDEGRIGRIKGKNGRGWRYYLAK